MIRIFRSDEPPKRLATLPAGIGLEVAAGRVAILFPAATPLPALHSEEFMPGDESQATIELKFLVGNGETVRRSYRIGRARIVGLPTYAGLRRIKVTFAVDVYGDLQVSAELDGRQLDVDHRLKRSVQYFTERRLRRLAARDV